MLKKALLSVATRRQYRSNLNFSSIYRITRQSFSEGPDSKQLRKNF